MIWFFKLDRASAGSCENYDELFQYIMGEEKLMLPGSHLEFERSPWSFTLFTPRQVFDHYKKTKQSLRTEVVKEASEKGAGIIVLRQGDPTKSIERLTVSDHDIEAIKKQWCLDYCKGHNYLVVENSFHTGDPVQTQWQFQDYSFG